jgi:nicotinamide riboside kinase
MKIAVSGTYSTGKTTLSLALSYLTGIPVAQARTMREILPDAFPGYSLEQCGSSQLIELGMRRFTERSQTEAQMKGSFISDGCALQEWLYGTTRLKTGFNPAENPETVKVWMDSHREEWKVFKQTIEAFGRIVKKYAKDKYDVIIHLPVEFPLVPDGHRPVNEYFRNESNQLLICTYQELGLQPFEVRGNMHERLTSIIRHFQIKPITDIAQAIEQAMFHKKHKIGTIQIEKWIRCTGFSGHEKT